MSFTNQTANYGLPQYVANDVPTWLQDMNGAFNTIDETMKSISDGTAQGLEAIINTIVSRAITEAHPIGSYYITDDNTNPSLIFSGTAWELVQDKFLFGSGTQGDSIPLGSSGGTRNNTLSAEQLPPHRHTTLYFGGSDNIESQTINMVGGIGTPSDDILAVSWTHTQNTYAASNIRTGVTGSGESVNNMPPYLAVRIWRRIS